MLLSLHRVCWGTLHAPLASCSTLHVSADSPRRPWTTHPACPERSWFRQVWRQIVAPQRAPMTRAEACRCWERSRRCWPSTAPASAARRQATPTSALVQRILFAGVALLVPVTCDPPSRARPLTPLPSMRKRWAPGASASLSLRRADGAPSWQAPRQLLTQGCARCWAPPQRSSSDSRPYRASRAGAECLASPHSPAETRGSATPRPLGLELGRRHAHRSAATCLIRCTIRPSAATMTKPCDNRKTSRTPGMPYSTVRLVLYAKQRAR